MLPEFGIVGEADEMVRAAMLFGGKSDSAYWSLLP